MLRTRSAHDRWIVFLDRLTLIGMAAGVTLILQPWWAGGLKSGFFAVLGFTIGQIIFSHLLPGELP